MSGDFVPMFDPPRNGRRSAKVGWITDENGCDIWQGARNNSGYGHVSVGGRRRRKMCLVHRLRYEQEIGSVPEGLPLDHFVCDNGPGGCCNPFHCRPASSRENTLRGNGVTSACAAKTHCSEGHPLAGENIRSYRGWRVCLICKIARDHRRRAAKVFA